MIEGINTEFKREFTEDIRLTVMAFANTDGGTLYIGMENDGTVRGVDPFHMAFLFFERVAEDGKRIAEDLLDGIELFHRVVHIGHVIGGGRTGFMGDAPDVDMGAGLELFAFVISFEKHFSRSAVHRLSHDGLFSDRQFQIMLPDIFVVSPLQIGTHAEIDGHIVVSGAPGDGQIILTVRHGSTLSSSEIRHNGVHAAYITE